MDEIVLDAYGKVNLGLDVLYKRDDGYHEINTIMQEIDLKDRIIMKKIDTGIVIESTDKNLPLGKGNLVYKAWEKLKGKTGVDMGVHIFIEKNIPIASGLAGGSSNCAAVLKGLNILWDLKLTKPELMDIGLEIGADVPFCILGGTAKATGVGEELKVLRSFSNKYILLANPGIPISTPYVYGNIDLNGRDIDIDSLGKFIEEDNLLEVARGMDNIMEDLVISEHPIIGEIKKAIIDGGALGSIMSGSGATVFGLFDSEEKLMECKKALEKKVDKVFAAKTR